MTTDFVLWGGTGQARVLFELLQDKPWRVVALVDSRSVMPHFAGVAVLLGEAGFDAWLAQRPPHCKLAGAVAVGGDRGVERLQLLDVLAQRGIDLPVLVHRTAFVASNSGIGPGSQVLAQANVCSHARLGRGVILNTAASVDHDCVLEDGVHLGPGARLAGEVTIGRAAFIGTGAIILPRIRVGERAVVGAGAVVTHDVPASAVVVGNPAHELRKGG